MPQPPAIAFVTTCKGRLHHLQQTLPLIAAQAPDEIAVVDYDCPQGSADWVEANFPAVKAVRVPGRPKFNAAEARNTGARATSAAWLCFIDADNAIAPGFVDWLRANLREGFFYMQDPAGKPLHALSEGIVVCNRTAFGLVEGYDEIIQGWGAEDTDFHDRLSLCGALKTHFPADLVSSIAHGEADRVRFYDTKNRETQLMRNRVYRIAKHQLMQALGVRTELAIDIRRQIHAEISNAFEAWMDDPTAPLPSVTISVTVEDPLTRPFKIMKTSTFTLALQ